MLPLLRRLPVARAAALLIVLTMSGVARAVPPVAVGPHRCTCSAGGRDHVCACRACNAAARRAREQHVEGLPPCHRAAAWKELGAADAEKTRAPCFLATCGVPPWQPVTAPALEPFPLVATPLLTHAEWSVRLAAPVRAVPDVALAPETPPPRR